MRLAGAAVFFAVLGVSVATYAVDLPELMVPQGVGVNIHFTRGHERDLDRIAAAGVKVVRMDFAWGAIERAKGDYDWSAYDELTANLEKRGIRPLYILDYSNSLYEETIVSRDPIHGKERRTTASPQHPESVAAFARWAAAAASRFAGRGVIWEIWNEPNIHFWAPEPDVDQYITLALATAKAVRLADPNAIVIGPATSQVPIEFMEALFQAGMLAQLDAISVHPYRPYHLGPETAIEDYHKLRTLIGKYASDDAQRELPIVSGEWGYSTYAERGVTLETQAAFLVRQQLVNLYCGIPISIWYDWVDDGPDPKEREHNFGTVTNNREPKPSYRALQRLTRELDGYRVERRLELANEGDWALVCQRGAERKLVAWTTGETHHVTIDGVNNGVTIELTPMPQYVPISPE